MRAVIPVAGVGTRLRPHTYTTPKVLLNVAGKPIIGHIMDKLVSDGFTAATFIVGHLGDQVEAYVRSQYHIALDFVEQDDPKGLAHAVSLARLDESADPLLIILGDTIFDVDLTPVTTGSTTAIGVKTVGDPRRFGVVELRDGFVTRMVEKPEHPPSHEAIVGLYWIRHPRLLHECIEELFQTKKTTRGEYQLTDALQLMIERGEKIRTFPVEGWFDCGKPETLLSTNKHLLEKAPQPPGLPGVVIIPPVFIAPTARVTSSVIGPYATLADGAAVEDSIIRDSIVGEKARVARSLLEHSIVGRNAAVSGGFAQVNAGDSSDIAFQ